VGSPSGPLCSPLPTKVTVSVASGPSVRPPVSLSVYMTTFVLDESRVFVKLGRRPTCICTPGGTLLLGYGTPGYRFLAFSYAKPSDFRRNLGRLEATKSQFLHRNFLESTHADPKPGYNNVRYYAI